MLASIRKATQAVLKSVPRAARSLYRPRYHFLPPANWMNDPNGTIYIDGEYHLFYQFNPYRPRWGSIHWGHAKSKDLVHWEHLPLALAPDGGLGELHCFSGCCVLGDDGIPVIFYTRIGFFSLITLARRYAQQWLATSDREMIIWKKHPANPVLSEQAHHGNPPFHWRDPYVWRTGTGWRMVLAGQYPQEKFGSVFLYRSADLLHWDFMGRLCRGDESLGKGWECPNYFRLGEKYVLVVSPYRQVIYSIGSFDGLHHLPETGSGGGSWHVLDHGKAFYATNTWQDDQGRTLLAGWIKVDGKGAWAGCLSLPREVSLGEGGFLTIEPLRELQALRSEHSHFETRPGTRTELLLPEAFEGDCVEILARYDLQGTGQVGFRLCDAKNEYLISLDLQEWTLQAVHETARLQAKHTAAVELHIFIDHSVIEIFINHHEVFTTIFYPETGPGHELCSLPFFSAGNGSASIDFWKLAEAPISGSIEK